MEPGTFERQAAAIPRPGPRSSKASATSAPSRTPPGSPEPCSKPSPEEPHWELGSRSGSWRTRFVAPFSVTGSVGCGCPVRLGLGPASATVSHALGSLALMALALPRSLTPVQGGVVQGLRPGLPVLGHRQAARAAVGARHQGHAGAPHPRAAVLRAAGEPQPAHRPGLPRPGGGGDGHRPRLRGPRPRRRGAGRVRGRRRGPGQALLPAGGPLHHPSHRPRAHARGHHRHAHPPGHHRPPRARRRRRPRRHRLQDGGGAQGRLRAEPPGRRPLLRLPLRAGARPAPGAHPAALPVRAGRHRGRAVRPVDPRPAAAGLGHLDRCREGVRQGGLPAPAVSPVRLVLLPGLLPRLRRRPRPGPGGGGGRGRTPVVA